MAPRKTKIPFAPDPEYEVEVQPMEEATVFMEEPEVYQVNTLEPTVEKVLPLPFGTGIIRKIHILRERIKEITPSKMDSFGLKYNYLSEREMTTTIRPVMQELGLVAIPLTSHQETISYDVGVDKDGKPRRVLLTQVHKTYRVYDVETGEYVDIPAEGSGADPMDKGINKALTGTFKNFLKDLGMFPSPERDDPDNTPSTSGGSKVSFTRPSGGYSSGDPGSILLKFGPDAGKTIQDVFDENPDKVEKMASSVDKNGNPTWLATKAKAFLESLT